MESLLLLLLLLLLFDYYYYGRRVADVRCTIVIHNGLTFDIFSSLRTL